MDLLGSIMSKMDKPPSINARPKKLMKEQQKGAEEAKARERESLKKFRKKIEEIVNDFFQDSSRMKMGFEPMDRVGRSIVRNVADVAGLTTYVFGVEEDRRVTIFKKEYPLSEDELNAYRNGHEWDPVQAKQDAIEVKSVGLVLDSDPGKCKKEALKYDGALLCGTYVEGNMSTSIRGFFPFGEGTFLGKEREKRLADLAKNMARMENEDVTYGIHEAANANKLAAMKRQSVVDLEINIRKFKLHPILHKQYKKYLKIAKRSADHAEKFCIYKTEDIEDAAKGAEKMATIFKSRRP